MGSMVVGPLQRLRDGGISLLGLSDKKPQVRRRKGAAKDEDEGDRRESICNPRVTGLKILRGAQPQAHDHGLHPGP